LSKIRSDVILDGV
jgi:hypothetical protein